MKAKGTTPYCDFFFANETKNQLEIVSKRNKCVHVPNNLPNISTITTFDVR